MNYAEAIITCQVMIGITDGPSKYVVGHDGERVVYASGPGEWLLGMSCKDARSALESRGAKSVLFATRITP